MAGVFPIVITQGVDRGGRQWSGRDRVEHGSKGARAGLEAGCCHHGANRGLALGRPHGAVAVGVLALDHRRSRSQALLVAAIWPGKDANVSNWSRARRILVWMSRARSQVTGAARLSSS